METERFRQEREERAWQADGKGLEDDTAQGLFSGSYDVSVPTLSHHFFCVWGDVGEEEGQQNPTRLSNFLMVIPEQVREDKSHLDLPPPSAVVSLRHT